MPFDPETCARRDSEDYERHWHDDSRMIPGWWIAPAAAFGLAVIAACVWAIF
ncbi:MAG: hypothetical protein ACQEUZ_06375 [Pseudomonadota bacterium]